jgi:sugar lactone lactonase YvrE
MRQMTTARWTGNSEPRVLAFLAMLACIGGCRLDASQTDYPGVNPQSPPDGATIPIVKPDLDAGPGPSDVRAPDSRGATGDDAPADATTARADGSGGGDSLPAGCGAARPDISRIVNTDGLAIGPDGTIYFTQANATTGWIGRLRPGDALPDPTWITVPGGTRLLGLAVDARGERLYVVSEPGHAINFVELGGIDPPSLQVLVTGLLQPNDAVVGPDGAIYFSDKGDGRIHSVSPDGITRIVTSVAIPGSPAGLAFGNQGELYVGVSPDGPIYQLNLLDGVEMNRARFGDLVAWGNGLVVDRAGRLYVSTYSQVGQGRVWRAPASGLGATVVLTGTGFGSMAFGRGALDCLDLYVAVPIGPLQRIRTDAPAPPSL